MNTARKPRVFISRTTAGLKDLADEIATILDDRGIKYIIQTEFLPDWRSVPQMLQQQIGQSDAVIALIGPVHGGEPDFEPARLNDKRTHGRKFSLTQWEYLVARDLKRPIFTFILSGDALITPFPKESAELEQRQQQFIADFPKDRSALYYEYTERQKLLGYIRAIEFEVTVLAGKPSNIPYTSLGTLFKGRDQFLAELRQHLTAEAPVVIKGKRTIHGMGGVGKTRAAIEYAWKHADNYNALLFISGDTPEALYRNLAALCGPLVLNLPEQDEREQALQFQAALRWLRLHPGWFLIIDNVDTDDAAEETKALLAKLTTGHVVITSRISDWTGHVKSLDLDVLSDTASIEFLDERTAERRIKTDTDAWNVQDLVHLLDCLALALEQAGAHISASALSYADYIALWESHRPTALAWHDEEKMKYPKSLAITYETSVAQLSSGAKELFRILSWFAPDPIPRNLINSRLNPADEGRHLSEMERLHLARYLGDGKNFAIHRLNQEITRQQQGEAKPEALIAAVEWGDGAYVGDPKDVQKWDILSPLTPHVVTAASRALDRDVLNPSLRLLNDAALMLQAQANYKAAEPLMRRILGMDEAAHGGHDTNVATSLNNLATLLQDTNRFTEAEPLFRRALAIDEAHFGKCHPKVASCINNLAILLQTTNRPAEAELLYRRALAIDESNLGAGQSTVAAGLRNLAQFLQATNRFSEAEPMIRRALKITEVCYGPDHLEVAAGLNNLATLLHDSNRISEAEPLMRRALAIQDSCFGKDHPKVAISLNNLAALLHGSDRSSEAEPLMRRALAINEACFGKNHPDVALSLSLLAGLLFGLKRLTEAEPLMRQALAIDEFSFCTNHPTVAKRLNNLAVLLEATNRPAEAEPLMRRALAIDEASLGEDDPEVGVGLYNLARLLQGTKRFAEAETFMRRSAEVFLKFTRDTGHTHPWLVDAIGNYIALLNEMGDTYGQALTKVRTIAKAYGVSMEQVFGMP